MSVDQSESPIGGHRAPRAAAPIAAATRSLPLGVLCAVLAIFALGGCVERIMKIQTNPPGAIVIINDEEVGVSPVKFSFLWYGDYEIILRKPGFETLKTHFKVDAPWWQYPPFDLVAETMIASTIRDERELPPFDLKPTPPTTAQELVGRATDMRGQAIFQP